MTFKPGLSGNPLGRPRGSNIATKLLDSIGAASVSDILVSVINAAKAGDMTAAQIVLARLWPVRRGRAIAIDLPDTRTLEGLQAAMAKVVEVMAAGQISSEEAASISAVLESNRKLIESCELQSRLNLLEEKVRQSNHY